MEKRKIIFFVISILLIGALTYTYFSLSKDNNTKLNRSSSTEITNDDKSMGSAQTKQVSIFAKGLDVPWSIAFLPTGNLLVTERSGTIRFVSKSGDVQISPIATITDVKQIGEGGLLGIAIDPEFPTNNFIYLYFTYSGVGDDTLNRVVRYVYKNKSLSEEKIIVDKIPGSQFHNGGRIKFGPDFFLYITTGDAQDPSNAQNKNSLAGKILRVSRYGQSVDGNTFGNNIYSYGHRNPQGITWDDKGNLWETEHGPSGIWPNCCQDELNKIEIGKNYGWPEFVGDKKNQEVISPVIHSGKDVWAPGNVEFLDGSLYFTGLRGESLYRYNIQNKKLETFFKGELGRLRDVVLGPDKMFYVTTSNRDGRGKVSSDDDKILKINPMKL